MQGKELDLLIVMSSKENSQSIKNAFFSVAKLLRLSIYSEKVQVGNDQEKTQSEGNSHSKNRSGKNLIDN